MQKKIEELENELSRYREFEEQLSGLLNQDPRLMEFLADWADGKSPVTSLVKRYGKELLDELQHDSTTERLQQLQEELEKKEEEDLRQSKEFEKNLTRSVEALKAYAKEKEIGDEELKEMVTDLIGIAKKAYSGEIAADDVILIRKGRCHDDDVSKAREEGELTGRNARIEELMKDAPIDLVPNLPHYAGVRPASRMSIFSLAAQARK